MTPGSPLHRALRHRSFLIGGALSLLLIVTALVGLAAYQTTTVQPLVVAVMAGSLAGIVTIVALRLLFHLVMGAFWLAKGVVVVLAVLFGVQLLTGAPWGSDAVNLLRELVQSLAE